LTFCSISTSRPRQRRARTGREGEIEDFRLLRQAPGDEPDAERRRLTCQKLLEARELAREPVVIAITAAQDSQSSSLADGGGQPRAGHEVHRRQQNRVCDAELARERIGECHGCPPKRLHEESAVDFARISR
jgi:hypothetical protein